MSRLPADHTVQPKVGRGILVTCSGLLLAYGLAAQTAPIFDVHLHALGVADQGPLRSPSVHRCAACRAMAQLVPTARPGWA